MASSLSSRLTFPRELASSAQWAAPFPMRHPWNFLSCFPGAAEVALCWRPQELGNCLPSLQIGSIQWGPTPQAATALALTLHWGTALGTSPPGAGLSSPSPHVE